MLRTAGRRFDEVSLIGEPQGVVDVGRLLRRETRRRRGGRRRGRGAVKRGTRLRQGTPRRRPLDGVWGLLGFGRHRSSSPKREGQWHVRRDEAVRRGQSGLRGGNKQHPLRLQYPRQHADGSVLGGAVEINQHVSTKDHVVDFHSWQKIGGEQISLLKADLLADGLAHPIILRRRLKMSIAEPQLVATKGIPSV